MTPRLTITLLLIAVLSACSSKSQQPVKVAFYVFRLDPSALLELSSDNTPLHEIPISIPSGCALDNFFPSPRGAYVAIELDCAFGQTVVWINTDTDEVKQAYISSDSQFLAWTSDGAAVYLKVDSAGSNPHIERVGTNGENDFVPITELTYDLSPSPSGDDFTFAFSRGMGLGSEMWLAHQNGNIVRQVAADKNNYLSFARWSPDGRQIAFIKIPDSATPFTVGQLWVMDANGSNARQLADADAGHGFPPAWSPDGKKVAFVVRENPQDPNADQSAGALISNIDIADLESRKVNQLTHLENARVEAPIWSPDGNIIVFTVVINDKMNVYRADVLSGETKLIIMESACCAAWIRK